MSRVSELPGQHEAIGPELGLVIDRDGDVPIGVQLAWALRARIGERQFEPGQRLPGLRDLAAQAGVNVNTARAVYQRLEQEGLIETQHGSGTFVAVGSGEVSPAGAIAAGAARKARQAGLDPREVAAALYVSVKPPSETAQASAARRATLRTQIAALETTLGELEGAYPGLAPPPGASSAGEGPRMLETAELEQVRAELLRRLSTVQAAIDALSDGEPLTQEKPQTQSPRRAPRKSTARKRVASPTTTPAPAGA